MKALWSFLGISFALGPFLLVGTTHAHPVSYKGAFSFMTWNQPFLNDFMGTYSVRSDLAIAARHMRMVLPDGDMQIHAGQVNYLVKRWNQTDSQANIYVFGGAGTEHSQGRSSFMLLPGIEADAESRQLYVSAKFQAVLPRSSPNVYQSQFRAGIAAYPSEFNEVASWFIVSLQHEPQLTKKVILTPMARFYYKNVLWEVGSSIEGDWMLNFMFHF